MTLKPRAGLALAALSLAGLALAACSPQSASSGPTSLPNGDSTTVPTDLEGTIEAVWANANGLIALLTWGSSSCVPVVSETTSASPSELIVTFVEPPADQACTMDYGPRLTAVSASPDVDESAPVTLTLSGDGFDEELTVAPYTGATDLPEGSSSLVWMQEGSMLALVTYGSSGCPPVVYDVAESADNTIDVTFADPPADRVCTADLAPRITGIGVPSGIDPNAAVTVTLKGDGFDESVVLEP